MLLVTAIKYGLPARGRKSALFCHCQWAANWRVVTAKKSAPQNPRPLLDNKDVARQNVGEKRARRQQDPKVA